MEEKAPWVEEKAPWVEEKIVAARGCLEDCAYHVFGHHNPLCRHGARVGVASAGVAGQQQGARAGRQGGGHGAEKGAPSGQS